MAFIKLSKLNYFHNLDIILKRVKDKEKLILVLKDNAYGHGIKEMSDMAYEYGIKKIAIKNLADFKGIKADFEEILLLAYVVTGKEDKLDKRLSFCLQSLEQIDKIASGVNVHLKIDTGMHRNGILESELDEALSKIKKKKLNLKAVYTHLASIKAQPTQLASFAKIKEKLKKTNKNLAFHSFNSTGLFNNTLPKDELCRIGLAQYGYCVLEPNLKPVLSLYAQKLSTREVKKGESVGYDGIFTAPCDMMVSNYDLGYGDGLFRYKGEGGLSLPGGEEILGIMSMDSFSVKGGKDELCVIKDARVMAQFYQSIVYEILTKLNANLKGDSMKMRVYYEDTDAGGVVYHANYLRFCERARSELFFEKEINIFDPTRGHFLLTKANCEFKSPARLGDMLDIKTKLELIKHASLQILQEIYRGDTLCFKAHFTLAYLIDEKVCPMPRPLVEAMAGLLSDLA